jgi:ligand-binding sensor domain-containing protein
MKYICNLTFLIFLGFFTTVAQSSTNLMEGVFNKQVLSSTNAPQSITRNIIQDRKGNIWMATWEGMIRYDGKTFSNLTSKVSSARFFSVLEDKKGNLWFGTIGSGVFLYDGASFKNFTNKNGLISNEITCIFEDKKGNIWFGGFAGASRYDGKSFRNFIVDDLEMKEDVSGKTLESRQPFEVNAIIEDKKGRFWFATRGNTFVYDPSAKPVKGAKTFSVIKNAEKPFTNVRSLIVDKKGNVWWGRWFLVLQW